jgi:hypothetical protein
MAGPYVLTMCSTLIQVPFLNLMANLAQRCGGVKVRVGGNTQETAKFVDSIPNGADLTKDYSHTTNPVSYRASFSDILFTYVYCHVDRYTAP